MYNWPGNVRELKNTIERMYVLSTSTEITMEDIPADIRRNEDRLFRAGRYSGMSLKEATDKLERILMEEAFEKAGTARDAAKLLGIDPSTFVRKRQKWENNK